MQAAVPEGTMTVNANAWKKFPIATREQTFNADDAILRIAEWASGSVDKFNSAFVWRNAQGPANNKNSYRLPLVDIFDGRPHLVPHAVFAAAAIMSGAHGGLEGVVTEESERNAIKNVLTNIYEKLKADYGDPRLDPPWLKGRTADEKDKERQAMGASLVASVNSSGWSSLPLADESTPWTGDKARTALWEWADGDFRQYRKGFLWWDQGAPDLKGSYKLPIATVADGQLVIVPRAVNAVAQILGGARGGVDIPDDDMDAVEAVVKRIQKRFDGAGESEGEVASGDQTVDDSLAAAAAPVRPPRDWFQNPNLSGPTPIAVTPDGRVMGHLAAWGVCHTKWSDRCVMAPRNASGYKYFLNGSVLTADGSTVKVGKITMGTGHADTRYGWIPAADHYDNTGVPAAVVATGEDAWGIWVAGAMTPETDERDAAQLRRSPLSGDWRRINGNMELVAALAVNTPGFPIISMTASGEPEALIAVGVIAEDGTVVGMQEQEEELSGPDKRLLERLDEVRRGVESMTRGRLMRRYNNLVSKGGK
jgi:hypothetical protein